MPEQLAPDSSTLVDDVVVTAPGLAGQVEVLRPGDGTFRAEEDTAAAFLDALSATGFEEQLSVVVSDAAELGGDGGSRSRGGGTDLVVEVPGPGSGLAQLMLYTAEDGTLTWHLPEEVPTDTEQVRMRGADRRTYRVPRVVSAPAAATTHRGVVGALAKKVLKVVAFRLVEAGAEFVAEKVADRWEARNRPHRLRSFTVDDYRTGGAPDGTGYPLLDDAALERMTADRALLFVHGTFSKASSGFGGLPPEVLGTLHTAYGGHVLALDHPTLATSPAENARWLAGELHRRLPAGRGLRLDVVAHSRGGLVARELCEHSAENGLADVLAVERLVMVGTPNAGTALASSRQWKGYVDRVTNLLQFVPDNPVTDTLDAALTLLKHVALGAVRGLDGLVAMDPDGEYLGRRLNRPGAGAPPGVYHAVAADFEPPGGSPLLRVSRDGAVDLVFGKAGNDLLVPRDGVFTVRGAGGFPIAEPLVFEGPDAVDHFGYFRQARLAERLGEWLAAGATR